MIMKTSTNYFLIKSNHGNHAGFNRTWSLISESENKKMLQKEMLSIAFGLSDDIVSRNGRPYNTNTNEYILTNAMLERGSFSEDGVSYQIVAENDEDFFDGGYNGYRPSFMPQLIEE